MMRMRLQNGSGSETAVNGSGGLQRRLSRKDSESGTGAANGTLESPSLVRKFSGAGSTPSSPTESNPLARSAPRIPVPSITTSPRPLRKLSDTLAASAASAPSAGSASPTLPVATSSPRLIPAPDTIELDATTVSLEESLHDISTSSDASIG